MVNFEDFLSDLKSDERWFEQASKNHRPETFHKVAEQVYTLALSDREAMSVIPIREHRNHVVNKLAKMLPDKPKVDWIGKANEEIKRKEEEKKAVEWVPLTGEARAKKLVEVKAIFDSLKTINVVPRLTNKEIIESGEARIPKANGNYHRSLVEQLVIAKESKERIRECRRKFFLDAFPDASEEEIHAYWQKFEDTKDESI